MDLDKWQKILIAAYIAFVVGLYASIGFEFESVLNYLDAVECIGFLISLLLIFIGIKKQPADKKLTWKIFALAIITYGLGDLIWAYYTIILNTDPSSPSICDFFYLLNTAIYVAGLIVYLKKMQTISFMAISFDMLISVFAAAGIIYNFMVVPILESPSVDYVQIFLQYQ